MNAFSNQSTKYFGVALHAAGAALIAVLVGLFYSVVYRPLDRMQEESVKRTDQLEVLLSNQVVQGSEYRRLRTKLNQMKQSVNELHQQLAGEFSKDALLAELTDLAEKSELQILDYQVGTPQRLLTHSLTEIEISCHGSYASICQFLKKAEQIAKVAKLSSLELATRDNSQRYPIQLTFVLYSEGKSNDTREERGVL